MMVQRCRAKEHPSTCRLAIVCRSTYNINVVYVPSGDNAVTAASIARQCGILSQQPSRSMGPGGPVYGQGQGGLAGIPVLLIPIIIQLIVHP